MRMIKKLSGLLLILCCYSGVVFAQNDELIHHSLKVMLDPSNRSINVEDTITLPAQPVVAPLFFSLNESLTVTDSPDGVQQLQNNSSSTAIGINSMGGDGAPTNRYVFSSTSTNSSQLVISYAGSIYDLAEQDSAEYAQSFSETTGIIDDLGVYLSKASMWIPEFDTDLITFDVQVEFADNANTWTVVSQGDRNGENAWISSQPMEEVYLVAADFTEYSVAAGGIEMLAYLRQPDSNLANKYLDATERYLALYEPLLGEYPFSKFALIENFWETGYGMPSFTLLGEQVIRFPFILESSYPHEILHNWWGNGVYPDYTTGNWSEGLTAYLADHLFQEMDGLGAEYRKEMLSRYKNYVSDGVDFPLAEFTSRNSAASQAVGYGKTLMLWHMLRLEVGDVLFVEGLRQLYQGYKFKRASFSDIAALFSELSERDLTAFFDQWVNRTGAPELALSVEETNDNQARIMFAQVQAGEAYNLSVPIALYYANEAEPLLFNVDLSQKFEGVLADDFENLQGVLVDPHFDLFRQLDREETPPTIGELFGSGQISFVLPTENRQQWTQMADAFSQGVDAEILYSENIEALPSDRPVWIMGKDNPFAESLQSAVALYGVSYSDTGVTLDGNETSYENRSTVLVGRHPDNPELAIGWIHIEDMVAMPGMIEKLPHYGKYSYLSFVGEEPTNDVSGIWSSPESPMMWLKPDTLASIPVEALTVAEPLAILPPKFLPDQLLRHVSELSTAEMEGRGLTTAGINRAAHYIGDRFREAGLQTLGGTYNHPWSSTVAGIGSIDLANVVGVLPGSNRELSSEPIILAAHYDHLGIDPESGEVYAGADDNASGVSILIEIASKLSATFTPQRPILFVAFTGEEAGLIGSDYFVKNPPGGFASEDLFAMINLDSVGRLEGRALQVFGTESAYEWPFMAQGIGFTIGVTSEFPAATIASSDHVSFLNAGVPAIHLFSGVHTDYHRTSDSVEKLDMEGMSNIALWVEEAVLYLADLTNPLRVTLATANGDAGTQRVVQTSASAGTERAAGLGTIPDFAYAGAGVKISGVTPNSAGEAAGLQNGDVLLSFAGEEIDDLQTYSNLLRQATVGDVIQLEVLRGDQQLVVEATLKAR
jgi:aminopeptidase N